MHEIRLENHINYFQYALAVQAKYALVYFGYTRVRHKYVFGLVSAEDEATLPASGILRLLFKARSPRRRWLETPGVQVSASRVIFNL